MTAGQVSTPHSAWIGGSGHFISASAGNAKAQARTPSGPSLTESEPIAGKVAAAKAVMKVHDLPERVAIFIARQDAMIENLLSRCEALEAQAAQASLPADRQTTSHINCTNQQSCNRHLEDSTVGTHRNRVTKEQVRPRLDNHRQQHIQPNPRCGVIRDGAFGRERSAGRRDTARATIPLEPKRMPSPGVASPKLGGFRGARGQSSSPRGPRVAEPSAFARKSTPSLSPARHDVTRRSPGTSARKREGSRGQSPTKSGPTGGSPVKPSIPPPSWSPRRGCPLPQRCRGQHAQPQPFSRQQQNDAELLQASVSASTLAASPTASADLTGRTGECVFSETAEPVVMTSSNAFNSRKTDTGANSRRSLTRFKVHAQSCRTLAAEPTRTKQGKTASQLGHHAI